MDSMLVEPAPLIFTGLVPPPNTRPLHESTSVIRARNKPFERLFSVSRIFYAIIYDLPRSSQRSLCRTTLAISREFQIRRAEARIRKEKLEHIFSLPPLLHIITEELFTPDVRNLSLVTLSLSRSLLGQPVAWRNVLYEFSRPAVGRALESPWDIKLLRDQCKSARAGRRCKSFQNSTTTRPLAPVREDREMFHVRFLRKMNLQFQLQAITRLDLDETGFGFDVVSGIVKAGARLKFLSVRHCRNVRTWEIAKLLGLEVGYRDYILPPAPPMGFEVAPMLKYFEQEREFLSYNGPVLDRLEGLQIYGIFPQTAWFHLSPDLECYESRYTSDRTFGRSLYSIMEYCKTAGIATDISACNNESNCLGPLLQTYESSWDREIPIGATAVCEKRVFECKYCGKRETRSLCVGCLEETGWISEWSPEKEGEGEQGRGEGFCRGCQRWVCGENTCGLFTSCSTCGPTCTGSCSETCSESLPPCCFCAREIGYEHDPLEEHEVCSMCANPVCRKCLYDPEYESVEMAMEKCAGIGGTVCKGF